MTTTAHPTAATGGSLDELSRTACFELLAQVPYGRFAVARREGSPLVVPVNFVLDGESIVFRTGPGTKLSELPHHLVSFQADQVDVVHRTGWSVLVEGVAFEMSEVEIGHRQLETWAPGHREHWVRIVPAVVTGRLLTMAPPPESDGRAYV
jgi:nitroimidazol reductase NimA-like FMN-containing flavoprotein (pyridoxamine 5'-phosphate oxidase superfamily)